MGNCWVPIFVLAVIAVVVVLLVQNFGRENYSATTRVQSGWIAGPQYLKFEDEDPSIRIMKQKKGMHVSNPIKDQGPTCGACA